MIKINTLSELLVPRQFELGSTNVDGSVVRTLVLQTRGRGFEPHSTFSENAENVKSTPKGRPIELFVSKTMLCTVQEAVVAHLLHSTAQKTR